MDQSKLSAGDAIIFFADLQRGIADRSLTIDFQKLRKCVGALAQLAKLFDLPVVISTVPTRDGKPTEILPEITSALGSPKTFERTSPDSMDNTEIVRAIEATGRKSLVMSGVATEVAVLLPSITAIARGYRVFVVVDACAGIGDRSEDAALRRLSAAGAVLTSVPTLVAELINDFAAPKGQEARSIIHAVLS